MRYPNRALHDKERGDALALVDSVTATAQKRIGELQSQRKLLDGEQEFYKRDPSRMPAKLRRQLEEVDAQLAAQQRFVAAQNTEKVRLNDRFDEELARLNLLWSGRQGSAATTVVRAASASRPASSSAIR